MIHFVKKQSVRENLYLKKKNVGRLFSITVTVQFFFFVLVIVSMSNTAIRLLFKIQINKQKEYQSFVAKI